MKATNTYLNAQSNVDVSFTVLVILPSVAAIFLKSISIMLPVTKEQNRQTFANVLYSTKSDMSVS